VVVVERRVVVEVEGGFAVVVEARVVVGPLDVVLPCPVDRAEVPDAGNAVDATAGELDDVVEGASDPGEEVPPVQPARREATPRMTIS
jgi:hypothetical protein